MLFKIPDSAELMSLFSSVSWCFLLTLKCDIQFVIYPELIPI